MKPFLEGLRPAVVHDVYDALTYGIDLVFRRKFHDPRHTKGNIGAELGGCEKAARIAVERI